MKIGIVSNLYPPYVRGGAEHVVVRTVEALTEMGHDVFIVTSRRKYEKTFDLSSNAVERIYRFAPKNLYFVLDDCKHRWPVRLVWHIIDAFSSYSARRVKKILKSEEPDVVITHNLKGIGLRIPRAIQGMEIPHVHLMHDLQLIIPSGLMFFGHERPNIFEAIAYPVYRFFTKLLLGRPDIALFPSEYLEKEYQKHGFFHDTDVHVLPNPAPSFPKLLHKNETDGPLRLFYLGQLEEHKGVEFLLEYMESTDRDIMLIIAGEGSLQDKVKEAADKNKKITYLGYISFDQILNVLEITDGLLVPSLCYENSPTVIYESLQAGVPVIASDIGGVGELVKDQENGFLFEPGSKADLTRAIAQLNAKRFAFTEERDDLRATVESYALETYADKLIRLLDSIRR
jgi:glycosyltransferase involved in cell wall biosynthesis